MTSFSRIISNFPPFKKENCNLDSSRFRPRFNMADLDQLGFLPYHVSFLDQFLEEFMRFLSWQMVPNHKFPDADPQMGSHCFKSHK